MQRTDARKFFKQWQREHPKSPIDAATWLRHFVNLQLKRTFQPTASLTATSNPATSHPTAAIPSCSPPTATVCPSSSHPTTAVPATSNPTTSHPTAAISSCSPSAATVPSSSQPTTAPPAINPATCHSTPLSTASSELDSDISVADVHAALDKLSHILGKLYALAINTRLNTWLETQGLRARGQAGFRQGYRTVDNCFILRALAERARSRGVKLYLCAVDFEKAFDSVDRPLLWAALQRAGIGGTMLQAIQAMYADVPDYCNAKKLTVNAKKTQVMIMRPGGGSGNGKLAAGESFEYAGLPLEVASSTKYLGLTFSQLTVHAF
ncbi:hypothetical protein D9Q98_007668 [Chlorella vulgaris]|uniref:Reverse transcriptase domain-containing protein n=1 Tax=Chlorella vulgaris TaxID=3077 RepID=A0A9D4TLR2_CHLVU|nr:hypothetical protein D9Q98_007668 [Chlorella vulgaris]